ncbi:hypothetical protein BDZ91DRAFT_734956 [Kalaharituber pfeilii]|nr:hypothetical protein BDZ91DRAFT_734956 [Kalaharituber pfeilii]
MPAAEANPRNIQAADSTLAKREATPVPVAAPEPAMSSVDSDDKDVPEIPEDENDVVKLANPEDEALLMMMLHLSVMTLLRDVGLLTGLLRSSSRRSARHPLPRRSGIPGREKICRLRRCAGNCEICRRGSLLARMRRCGEEGRGERGRYIVEPP